MFLTMNSSCLFWQNTHYTMSKILTEWLIVGTMLQPKVALRFSVFFSYSYLYFLENPSSRAGSACFLLEQNGNPGIGSFACKDFEIWCEFRDGLVLGTCLT